MPAFGMWIGETDKKRHEETDSRVKHTEDDELLQSSDAETHVLIFRHER